MESCLKEKSIFDNQQHLCKWVVINDGQFDEQSICKYQHQTVSWRSTILISVLVTLFSSIGTLLVDYLFIDILSAPTADSIKSSAPSIRAQLSKQYLSLGQSSSPAPSPNSNKVMRVSNSRLTRATSTLKDSLLTDAETRILPPELVEAYSEAVNSFGKSLEDTQEKMKLTSERKRTQRLTKVHSFQAKSFGKLTSDNVKSTSGGKENMSSDELLTSLLIELKEERSRIKREVERQAFDSIWG